MDVAQNGGKMGQGFEEIIHLFDVSFISRQNVGVFLTRLS